MQWVINYSSEPPSILPEGLDTSNLRDITCFGNTWKRFIDIQTGEIHDGSEYLKQMQKEMKEIQCR